MHVMKNVDFVYKDIESFEFILNSDEHSISGNELIDILTNSRQLLKGINVTLNKSYSIGYDIIDFDVIALEAGSFKIPISIKKFSNAVAVNAIGGIIAGLFIAECQSVKVQSAIEEYEITKEELMANHDTKTAVVNIAKTTVASDSITGLSMNYICPDGSVENLKIEKTRLEPIASINTDIEPEIDIHTNTLNLIVVAPVLEPKKVLWKFKTVEEHPISAKMEDEAFLLKMEQEHIAFGRLDVLRVQLQTTVTIEDGEKKVGYVIKKVLDYPKYKKNDREEQTEIVFEE